MPVFNSLGSNYDFSYVLRSIFSFTLSPKNKLKNMLHERYGGEVHLFYKGRQAITAALELSDLPKDSAVLVNGYTCLAVWQAVHGASLQPILIDPAKDSLDFSVSELASAIKKYPQAKAVVIQHTLGYTKDIQSIRKLCDQQQLVLIEDLAHSVGASYQDGQEVGTYGDFTVLSFSQDKVIDGVSGGALIDRRSHVLEVGSFTEAHISFVQQLRDRLYPLNTWLIRSTYSVGAGKLLHRLLKQLKILSSPMALDLTARYYTLPDWHAKLALWELKTLDSQLELRRQKAHRYQQLLPKDLQITGLSASLAKSTALRFPIQVSDPQTLLKKLASSGFHLTDRWFDAPIGPKKYMQLSDYRPGTCPNGEQLSATILNLPTHVNISLKQVESLCERINACL